MPVPDFQSLMLPVLRALADGKDTPVRDVGERVASAEGLADKDLQEMLPWTATCIHESGGLGAQLPPPCRFGGTGPARRIPGGR